VKLLCLAILAACLPAPAENADWQHLIGTARDLLRRNLLTDAETAYRATERLADDRGDAERLAVTRVELGYVLTLQSRYADAEALHEESIRALIALNPNHPAIAVALVDLCEIHWRQGALQEAQNSCERALALQQRSLGKRHSEPLHTLNLLAGIHLDRGQHNAAQRYLNEAMAGAANLDVKFQAAVLANLGRLQQDTGNLRAAEESLQRARRLMEAQPDADVEALLTVLNNIAIVDSRLGRHDRAEVSLAEAAERTSAALGPNHPMLASILLNRGVELEKLKRFDEAECSLRRAVEIQKLTLGPSSLNLATTLSYYARVLARMGRKDEARELKSEVQAILEEQRGDDALVSMKELEMNAPAPRAGPDQ